MLYRHGLNWINGWIAYSQIEPFGQIRNDWLSATIATTIANSSGKIYESTVSPEQFVPSLKEVEEQPIELTPQQKTQRIIEGLMGFIPETIDKRNKQKG